MSRKKMVSWVHTALMEAGGEAPILDLAKMIWQSHEAEIRASGDFLFSWQYDMRWAAVELRKSGKMAPASSSQRGIWALRHSPHK